MKILMLFVIVLLVGCRDYRCKNGKAYYCAEGVCTESIRHKGKHCVSPKNISR